MADDSLGQHGSKPAKRGRHLADKNDPIPVIARSKPALPTEKEKKATRKFVLVGFFSCILTMVVQFFALEKIKSLPLHTYPIEAFPNVYELDAGLFFINILATVSGTLLLVGLLSMLAIKVGPDLINRMGKPVAFLMIILVIFTTMYISKVTNEATSGTSQVLLQMQPEWAEKRYGLTYDKITVHHYTGKHRKSRQDKVLYRGSVVAEVCNNSYAEVRFCKPGTDDEFPVLVR